MTDRQSLCTLFSNSAADKSIKVSHVAGIDNVSDIFTKEMRDVSHFCRLRDSFMSRLADFNLASRVAAAATAFWC